MRPFAHRRRTGRPVLLELEPGRYLAAESGLLVAEVRAIKSMGRQRFVLVDAGFNDLMRPAMYGATMPSPPSTRWAAP